jgi:hypothetical protein
MNNHTKLRIGTDTANVSQFETDPLRSLLFGFQTEFFYILNFWHDTGDGGRKKWPRRYTALFIFMTSNLIDHAFL